MQEIEFTFKRFVAIAWAWAWRAVAGGAAIGFAGGFVFGFGKAVMHMDPNFMDWAPRAIGTIGGFIWGFFALRMALEKQYKEFRIALVLLTPDPLK